MAEPAGDQLGDLLRSPLDELPVGMAARWRLALAAGAAACVAAAATLAGLWALPDSSPGGVATIATIPAPTAPPSVGLPPGYVETGAGFGIRVEWIMQRPDELLVGLSSAVPNDAGPSELRPIGTTILGPTRRAVGAWTLHLADGRTVAHRAELLDDGAIGMVTISFPVAGLAAGDVVGLGLAPAAGAGMRLEETRIPVAEFPVDLAGGVVVPATELVEAGGGTPHRSGESRLLVERLHAGWSSGWIDWSLEGIEGVGARLEAVIVLVGDDVADQDQTVLVTDGAAGVRFLQRPPAPITPAASASIHLVAAGRRAIPEYPVTALDITWTVTWSRFADAAIPIPVEGAPWIGTG